MIFKKNENLFGETDQLSIDISENIYCREKVMTDLEFLDNYTSESTIFDQFIDHSTQNNVLEISENFFFVKLINY